MAKIGENRRLFFFEKASIGDKNKTIPHKVRCAKQENNWRNCQCRKKCYWRKKRDENMYHIIYVGCRVKLASKVHVRCKKKLKIQVAPIKTYPGIQPLSLMTVQVELWKQESSKSSFIRSPFLTKFEKNRRNSAFFSFTAECRQLPSSHRQNCWKCSERTWLFSPLFVQEQHFQTDVCTFQSLHA